jgi:hypothetical protein
MLVFKKSPTIYCASCPNLSNYKYVALVVGRRKPEAVLIFFVKKIRQSISLTPSKTRKSSQKPVVVPAFILFWLEFWEHYYLLTSQAIDINLKPIARHALTWHRFHSLADIIWPVEPALEETTYFMYVLYIDFPRNFPPKLSKISNMISRRDLWSSCIKENKTYIDSCPEFLQHLRGHLQMPLRHIIRLLSIEGVGDGPAKQFFRLVYKIYI